MKRCLALAALLAAMVLTACGDSDNYVTSSSHTDRYKFYYYYGQECDYDVLERYGCYDAYSLSRSLFIGLSVDSDGYAVLEYLGEKFVFYGDEYDVGTDDRGFYYQFPMHDGSLTVFMDGSEAIYSIYNPFYEYHYYYDLY
ncbi:hypothetical protein [Fibrobacter sp.]|uniref:hypothetical protein n=1 Tax=Fibrobacter sp. TaxID=35828 RepID=UPI001B0D72C5|nr:hypothetical protein [Fibrobacter sp.]MBO7062502.1 hypothetical protein [Fibrobacter sp.]MBO7104574.1 hypothetical protein [Fibrobacter sp.]